MEKNLKLSLTKEPFINILSGKKDYEFRCAGNWIESRLFDKEGNLRSYDYIEFTNGYGKDRPWFKCEFKGVQTMQKGDVLKMKGKEIQFEKKEYAIRLGEIVSKKNILAI